MSGNIVFPNIFFDYGFVVSYLAVGCLVQLFIVRILAGLSMYATRHWRSRPEDSKDSSRVSYPIKCEIAVWLLLGAMIAWLATALLYVRYPTVDAWGHVMGGGCVAIAGVYGAMPRGRLVRRAICGAGVGQLYGATVTITMHYFSRVERLFVDPLLSHPFATGILGAAVFSIAMVMCARDH